MTPGQQRKQDWVAALAGTDPDLVIVTGDNIAARRTPCRRCCGRSGPLLRLPGAFVFGSNDYRGPV